MVSAPLLLALPWLVLALGFAVVVRLPRPLPARGRPQVGGESVPSVSVIVPARNEAQNIDTVLASLGRSDYPDFEVVVVDDRSDDGTRERARAAARGRAGRLIVVDGAELPPGWLGKPWACHQGALEARGELLLFTDADTRHGRDLLSRAVAGLEEDHAGALTVLGRQVMESFWEKLVQPQIFATMLARYPRLRRPLSRGRWRSAIANGQYLLFRRATYLAVGGHAAVRGEVVEDLKLAQALLRSGEILSVRRAEDALATRMYRSLGELVSGWSKNVVLGGRASLPPGALRSVSPAGMILTGMVLWLAPPLTLIGALAGLGGAAALTWALAATGVSVLFWAALSARSGVSPLYGLLYPLGSAAALVIFARAWARGTRVEWKGRRYRLGGVDGGGEVRRSTVDVPGHGSSDRPPRRPV